METSLWVISDVLSIQLHKVLLLSAQHDKSQEHDFETIKNFKQNATCCTLYPGNCSVSVHNVVTIIISSVDFLFYHLLPIRLHMLL